VLHPLRCGGFRPSIDHRSRAKAGDLFRIGEQSAAQPAATERHVYHMIASEYPAHLCRSEHSCKRQMTPKCTNFVPSALGAVQRCQQQGSLSGADGLANLLETGNGETGAAGEPDRIATTLCKQGFDVICKSWRQGYRPSRRTSKKPLSHRPFQYIAARRQP
jgi:hypothetical protein